MPNTCPNSKQGRVLKKQSDLGLRCLSRPFWQTNTVELQWLEQAWPPLGP